MDDLQVSRGETLPFYYNWKSKRIRSMLTDFTHILLSLVTNCDKVHNILLQSNGYCELNKLFNVLNNFTWHFIN